MKVRRYNYIVHRVDYPAEHGYRMEPMPLPDWIYITITEQDDSKFLTVHSRIHKNKEVIVYPVYSNEFSDYDIIKEQSAKVRSRFL